MRKESDGCSRMVAHLGISSENVDFLLLTKKIALLGTRLWLYGHIVCAPPRRALRTFFHFFALRTVLSSAEILNFPSSVFTARLAAKSNVKRKLLFYFICSRGTLCK